ncbi:DUF6629 family protein [Streptomyces spectabilis]|uniref:Uncharacterized protein n=1 Tax=Streptomyces spectabilis TaxID=68270 RepID=A0A5P2X4D8_STRST|nr:DUF6629 family protein [Streptomyces spectabilis]MBB5107914.1 hypothetical protein [Streptomyces spectabilis]MCI3899755.1 hypothetical protein [Streptomyces spectabilis]QEV57426.1 hypothetical protein CP982_00630 [Streptomyces spectabilis]
MCWSATADLIAGTGITAVGIATVARAARRPRDLPLAALPLLLGAHQLIEAAVWHHNGGSGPATTAWAVIALPLLPLWVPAAVLCAAPPHARRRLLIPLAAGIATSAALAYALVTRTVTAEIREHTVGYTLGLSHTGLTVTGYLLATVGSLLLSGDRVLTLLGILAAIGAAVSFVLWQREFISTWCASAAVASVVLYHWARQRHAAAPETAASRVRDRRSRHLRKP